MRRWLVATFKKFDQAEDNLRDQGFDAYSPRYLVRRAVRGRVVATCQHLFGSYFFVGGASVEDSSTVSNTRGVGQVIGPVTQRTIDILKSREVDGYVDREPGLMVGQKVRVVGGMFAEQIGIYDGSTRRDRERIFVDMWNGRVRVEVPAGSLIAA